ncbi:NAD-dependent epimerase/dehydratase family protein [Streptomyces pratensis]|uniref:NAD-dependent epimerase/dehydratase family protein n=1 Tax=Streptomyces pratensis TaxID=1169025 RepID=UPI0030174FDB
MRLLVLGGTEFVGRAVTDAALARDWQVTVFHRGRHAPPPGVSVLTGDRTGRAGGLTALAGSDEVWDLVVDTWSGAPAAVRDAARLLSGRAGHYAYVSSRSVYAFPAAAGLDEDGPVVAGASPDEDGDVPYDRAKRGGELAALDAFGDRALLARAGLIIGPGENIGRLPWWLSRTARGGPVIAPGPRTAELQYVDARDLAEWLLDASARGLHGAYNTVSRPGHTTMGELLDACVDVTGADAELRWTDPEVLTSAGVEPWSDLPIWLPEGELHDSLHRGGHVKAYAAGLRCRPVAETVADTWSWMCDRGGVAPRRADRPSVGLDPLLEAKLLTSDAVSPDAG